MLYVWIILIANLLIIAANLLCSLFVQGFSPDVAHILLMPPISTVAVIAVDGIAAFIIRRLPQKWFAYDSIFSRVSKKECAFYTKLGVRKWRTKVPELGMFTGFHKNKVYEPDSNDYLMRYILEANYGFVIHVACVPVGFLIILICPLEWALSFGIPVAIVNAVLNLMPAFILRYNIPRLLSLMRMNDRRKTRPVGDEARAEDDTKTKVNC